VLLLKELNLFLISDAVFSHLFTLKCNFLFARRLLEMQQIFFVGSCKDSIYLYSVQVLNLNNLLRLFQVKISATSLQGRAEWIWTRGWSGQPWIQYSSWLSKNSQKLVIDAPFITLYLHHFEFRYVKPFVSYFSNSTLPMKLFFRRD